MLKNWNEARERRQMLKGPKPPAKTTTERVREFRERRKNLMNVQHCDPRTKDTVFTVQNSKDDRCNVTEETASIVHNNEIYPEAAPDFDPSLSEEERRFYLRAYPNVDLVRERKVHCTICKMHIGTAPAQEENIRMHPVLRVTHCLKCHDFYNSGEFSKGEDGSELYCRWCGQGGEVYCCSSCPYVFCKSCIVKNLSRGVVVDIEQNENWNCFSCAPKILWPLRAQHWALIRFIAKQKKSIESGSYSESEKKNLLSQDRSTCCRLAKSKCGNMSDSLESLDSTASRRSHGSSSAKKQSKSLGSSAHTPPAKRPKTSNDEVVCTPDLLSMLEPDCQITVQQKSRPSPSPTTSTPKIISLQTNSGGGLTIKPHNNTPPPLVLRNTGLPMRHPSPAPVVRRTIIGARNNTPTTGNHTPVYHTINGYRIDLNSAAQQETFRLPNGKLIQVKRQGTNANQGVGNQSPNNPWMRQPSPITTIQHAAAGRPIQITPASSHATQHYYTVQQQQQQQHNQQQQQQHHPQMLRYSNTTVTPVGGQNGSVRGAQIQVINGIPVAPTATPTATGGQQAAPTVAQAVRTPVMVRHVFPDTAIGQARTQLQDQVFNAMEICQHLTGKVQTLTNSNAYKQARNYLEVKELYIHLSYLLTYAIGRFKGLQDKCLGDMRQLGFVNDADSLENGQLAAGVDYVRYGQLEDIDLFNTSANSFHNQVYEYRKSLYANLEKSGESDDKRPPLSPLMPLGQHTRNGDEDDDEDAGLMVEDDHQNYGENNETYGARNWMRNEGEKSYYDDDDEVGDTGGPEALDDTEANADADMDDDDFDNNASGVGGSGGDNYGHHFNTQTSMHFSNKAHYGTEDYMSQEEQTHARDRKLARLIQKYPAIWCTRHPDYGNFEVTRKLWRTISAQFKRTENIKLRWKNIRKRYVRVERRVRDGKRFNGYFDKTTNFLANRELPEDQWVEVDCGSDQDDGGGICDANANPKNKLLNAGEKKMLPKDDMSSSAADGYLNLEEADQVTPIEVRPLDIKIINFVKCNPVLWRKSADSQYNHIDEQARKSLWSHLWKSTRLPDLSCEDIIDRWTHLYEMYKSFRLKTIKDETRRANLELKYSKYLTKLYFLYKIVEEDLRNEDLTNIDIDLTKDLADDNNGDDSKRLQDEPDDREFMVQLVRAVQRYPMLWDKLNIDYYDTVLRENIWQDVASELKDFKHKQASDDEDNEIEIVEPKTDTITLDSDNEDDYTPQPNAAAAKIPPASIAINSITANNNAHTVARQQSRNSINIEVSNQNQTENELVMTPNTTTTLQTTMPGLTSINSTIDKGITINKLNDKMEEADMMSVARTFLVSLLEVDSDAAEGGSDSSTQQQNQRKQPRKKTTNKPNPTLLKQKELLERERLEEMKRNDQKLKMKCAISLKKAEEEYPFAKDMLEKHGSELLKRTDAAAAELDEKVEKMETDDDHTAAEEQNEKSSDETTKAAAAAAAITTKENMDNSESGGEVEILTVDLESSAEDGDKGDRTVVMVEEDEEEDEGVGEGEKAKAQKSAETEDTNSKQFTIVMGGDDDDDDDEDDDGSTGSKGKALIIEVKGNNNSSEVVIDTKEAVEKDNKKLLTSNKEKSIKDKVETVSECAKRVIESVKASEKKKEMEKKVQQAAKVTAAATTTHIDKDNENANVATGAGDDTIEPILIEETEMADSIESPRKHTPQLICDDGKKEATVPSALATKESNTAKKAISVKETIANISLESDDEHGANQKSTPTECSAAANAAELNEPEIDVEKEIEKLLSKVPEDVVTESEAITKMDCDETKIVTSLSVESTPAATPAPTPRSETAETKTGNTTTATAADAAVTGSPVAAIVDSLLDSESATLT